MPHGLLAIFVLLAATAAGRYRSHDSLGGDISLSLLILISFMSHGVPSPSILDLPRRHSRRHVTLTHCPLELPAEWHGGFQIPAGRAPKLGEPSFLAVVVFWREANTTISLVLRIDVIFALFTGSSARVGHGLIRRTSCVHRQ